MNKIILTDVIMLGTISLIIGSIITIYSIGVSINMRIKISNHYCKNKKYVNNVSVHGLTMIFFAVMPFLISGKGNIIVPTLVGVDEVIFPRINNISIIILIVSIIYILNTNIFLKSKWNNGWTLYPPLSTSINYTSPLSIEHIILGLLIAGISSTLTSLNLYLTTVLYKIHNQLNNYLVYIYTMNVTSILLILCLPILTVILVLLLTDVNINTNIYNNAKGGDNIIYQHLFWFFGHPEVYILILPTFGVVSIVINMFIANNQVMIINTISIGVIGLQVWAHHMYTSTINIDTRAYHNSTTLLIGIPTSAKIYTYLMTTLNF
jgi:cytochrome c oxidase subunit 1